MSRLAYPTFSRSAKRWILTLLFSLPLLLGVSLFLRFYGTWSSPYRMGQALAPFPRGIALRVCQRFGPDGPRCLQGYFRARLKGPLQGDPLAPCRGLPSPFLRSCAAVQGSRFYTLSNPFGGCARFIGDEGDKGAYLACAEFVGREAFARAGFNGPKGAREICAKGEGEAQVYCRMGATKKAIEWYGVGMLEEALQFCDPQNPTCARGILEAMQWIFPREEGLKACELLPLPLFARCVVIFNRP